MIFIGQPNDCYDYLLFVWTVFMCWVMGTKNKKGKIENLLVDIVSINGFFIAF